jgi:hypothetical protein
MEYAMSTGEVPLMNPAHFGRLKELCERLSIVNLVETGTGPRSSGLEFAKTLGLRGYSCDVAGDCVDRARGLYPDFKIYHGESLGFLAQVLPALVGPTFFWLDGHCPTAVSDLPGPVFPPYEEMLMIKALKKGYEKDAMWLDDVAMITAPDNPVSSIWGGHLGGAGRYFYGADEHSWAEYHAVFAETHKYETVQGILEVTPK